MPQVNEVVTLERRGAVALVRIDNPPVNALGHRVREGLFEAIGHAEADPGVGSIVIACAGRSFVAGADVREFGQPPAYPSARDVMARIEQASLPVVAAMHGTALGGGLELALACHYRVADAGSQLGLPEVKLGLLPGAGGTQRLPRLIGVPRALGLILSGDSVGAAEARELGLVDAVIEGDLEAGAVAFAAGLVDERAPLRKVRERVDRLGEGTPEFFAEARRSAARQSRGLPAPGRIIDCVEAAVNLPFDEGMRLEREAFEQLRDGAESKALRHVFFAERSAAKVPGIGTDVPQRPIRRVAVIGAGTMGGGIAMNFLNAGLPVALVETSREALDRGIATIRANYERSASRGKLTPEAVRQRMDLLSGSLGLEAATGSDLVIEAVFEDMSLKKSIFARLDQLASPGAILATNTSYLDIDEIAASTSRPGDVVGLHFFSPANVMRLLEIVRGRHTAPDVIATAMALARRIGKVPVLVGVCHGFVGNRMLSARRTQAFSMIQEGAMPWDVDRVLEDFGMPMGPFAMTDLAGLDVGWSAERSRGDTVLRDRLCELGRRGQKTGAGYYRYDPRTRARSVDPLVESLVVEYARKSGKPQRVIGDQEILERCLFSSVNEGARILDEGVAQRASDIDVVWVNGYGWPRHRGGPMYWAETLGWGLVLQRIEHYAHALGPEWEPAPLLRRLAACG